MTAAAQTELERELSGFLDRYAAAYNRQAYAELLEMWDTGEPDVFYMAEEVDPPMYGWEAIRAYFNRPGTSNIGPSHSAPASNPHHNRLSRTHTGNSANPNPACRTSSTCEA